MDNLQHLISIIIPTYNRAHLIGETLDSVISQTYKNWECLVVDDGSTDYTEELIDHYSKTDSRIKFYKRPRDRAKGANACRNYGFEISKGEYVNWFDSDDLMHPSKLELQVASLEKSDLNFDVCQSVIFKDDRENILGLRSKKIYSERNFYDYLTQKISWLTQAPIWRRSFLLSQKRLFDEKLQAGQEWEFHSRILSKCKNYSITEKPLVYLRYYSKSITHNPDQEEIRIWNYFLARAKIYFNKEIFLDAKSQRYLQNIMLYHFKKYTAERSFYYSLKSYYFLIFKDAKMQTIPKFYATLGLISFLTTGKGIKFLKKVKY